MNKLTYTGKDKTRQYPGGHWLYEGCVVEVDDTTAEAFIKTGEFKPIEKKIKKVKAKNGDL